jgi:hypothetical protein
MSEGTVFDDGSSDESLDDDGATAPVEAPQEEEVPEVISHLVAEESEGKFRRLSAGKAVDALKYYAAKTRARFEHANPRITAPGEEFVVLLGESISDGVPIAKGYTRIASSAHGDYVEISPSQLSVDPKEFTQQRDSKLTAEYLWIGFKYLGHSLYYSGESLSKSEAPPAPQPPPPPSTDRGEAPIPGGQLRLTKFFAGCKTAAAPRIAAKKVAGPHQHKEFVRNMFYAPTADSFAVRRVDYEKRSEPIGGKSKAEPPSVRQRR